MAAGSISVPYIIPLRPPVSGKLKNQIDTNTKIEINSESPNVDIFYTLDGTKPDPFNCAIGQTVFQYGEPIYLPDGKQTVKAIAIQRDGRRESHICTKQFSVEKVPPPPGSEARKPRDSYQYLSELKRTSNKPRTSERTMARKKDEMMGKIHQAWEAEQGLATNRSQTFTGRTATSQWTDREMTPTQFIEEYNATKSYPIRTQLETELQRCVRCGTRRPHDPTARFCNSCGHPVPPLPDYRLPPPDPAQLVTCLVCKARVPVNTGSCLACETPLPPQLLQRNVQLEDRRMCLTCGLLNPLSCVTCLSCASLLPNEVQPVFAGSSAPPLPDGSGQLLKCVKCSRVNNPDARFCDWCGAKPAPATSNLTCSKCGGSSSSDARFCSVCGIEFAAPYRRDVRNTTLTTNQAAEFGYEAAHWQPVLERLPEDILIRSSSAQARIRTPMRNPIMVDKAVSTVGIWYPSQRELDQRGSVKNNNNNNNVAVARKPLLTSVSPGRGYWHQQIKHVQGHLEAHAQNDSTFRSLIGPHRMGKLIAATIHEDGYELDLRMRFNLPRAEDPHASRRVTNTYKNLSSYFEEMPDLSRNERMSESEEELETEDEEEFVYERDGAGLEPHVATPVAAKRKVVRKKKPVLKNAGLPPVDRALLREVGPDGMGRVGEVQRLLDEGANPNVAGSDGGSALLTAVASKHADTLPVLAAAGGNVNNMTGPNGGTPLHSAVANGDSRAVDILLQLGANVQKRNKRDETPYDAAAKASNDGLCRKLAAKMGQKQLDRLLKSKDKEDDF